MSEIKMSSASFHNRLESIQKRLARENILHDNDRRGREGSTPNHGPRRPRNFTTSPSEAARSSSAPSPSRPRLDFTPNVLEGNSRKRTMNLETGGNRTRRPVDIDGSSKGYSRPHHDSSEIDQKYDEIMKQSGILTLDGKKVQTDINDLDSLGELGHGTCGQVNKMRHKCNKHIMAVKQMRRSGNREENKRIIMDLDVVLKSHDCPYIVQCIGTFITNSEVWICMEIMATCFDKLLKSSGQPIPENILGKTAIAVVNALNYLKESHGVIHRDVKPSNILLDEKGTVKLCDFGISGRLVDSKAKTRSAGCAAYMAPERIDPPDPTKPDYDIRADVWSLGISLVELATGEFPYRNCKTDFEVLTKVLEEDPPLLPAADDFSFEFQSFVTECLTKDYKKRPKYKKLLDHQFIKRYTKQHVNVAAWYAETLQRTEKLKSTHGITS
ncbi:dual specificity mitogen-activated protein kinase kinase 7 [Patella vulgata]|uniref:dual specificity mitogen-activated protein kinase kinase 7 n=1 Tax=Patella vulgata TaxID=6465 RepID=UPI00217FB473|nr:dual specificity mitogen-activated protein kinase kinase 7 [Patella vulgata]